MKAVDSRKGKKKKKGERLDQITNCCGAVTANVVNGDIFLFIIKINVTQLGRN